MVHVCLQCLQHGPERVDVLWNVDGIAGRAVDKLVDGGGGGAAVGHFLGQHAEQVH